MIRDFANEKPVPDRVFAIIENLYRYDPAPLDSVLDPVEENTEFWKKQKVTFNAAYGNERMFAYLYLPKNASPPYQTVVYFPGTEALDLQSSRTLRCSAGTSSSKAAGHLFAPSTKAITNVTMGSRRLEKVRLCSIETTSSRGRRTLEERLTT
ncbi:MAG TPA: hypothetical protein VMG63_15330 [Terriglobia bacterium]|nr:hypothetical protein [Terriglobia bacterium]